MIRGRDLLRVCDFLESMDGEESARSQTSRAYYAAYLEARSYCEDHLNYRRTKSSREHQEVPQLVAHLDHDLAIDLAFLRRHRNIADYDIELGYLTILGQSVWAKTLASSLIARLDELAAVEPVRHEPGNVTEP